MRGAGQMIRGLFFAPALACCNWWAGGQTTPTAGQANSADPEYDVATVKVNNTGRGSSHFDLNNEIPRTTNVPFWRIIALALDVRHDQLAGLPHWASEN